MAESRKLYWKLNRGNFCIRMKIEHHKLRNAMQATGVAVTRFRIAEAADILQSIQISG